MPDSPDIDLGPWNPGLTSRLPAKARPLSTIYRPENSLITIEEVDDRAAFTGLDAEELMVFHPERLIVHELLIRVTGDLSIPDGRRYGDLGINFRAVVDTILKRYVQPEFAGIVAVFDQLRVSVREEVEAELEARIFAAGDPVPAKSKAGMLGRWFGWSRSKGSERPAAAPRLDLQSREDRERSALASWQAESTSQQDPRRRRVCRALYEIISAISIKHGCVRGERAMLVDLVTDRVMNDHGSWVIGERLEPMIETAVQREGYRLLPLQREPVVMNVKGASAAGKSTLRPLQRQLASRLGIEWADFALISPDIWRKYLLDYNSLGPFWRYAGTLTGHELKIVDQKLDRYMAEKARQGRVPHLLIDRFRFDSFAESEGGEQGARLLTRFGSTVYMFFVITPPDATVERAWKRGLEFGRFKAVDDLLHHNVEAFTGMPDLFFTWALRQDKRVHYEFLDNSVPFGESPGTIAFGWNGEMTILDTKGLIDIDRYRRINVDATSSEAVYPETEDMKPENNTAFLRRCQKLINAINIVAPGTDKVMARIEKGRLCWIDEHILERANLDAETTAGLAVLAPIEARNDAAGRGTPEAINLASALTLGSYRIKDQDAGDEHIIC